MNRNLLIGVVISLLLCILAFHGLFRESQVPSPTDPPEKMIIRESAVAGQFYPSSAPMLTSMITQYLDEAPILTTSSIQGLVCPHAGYMYSGSVAAYGYSQLSDLYDTVIILGPTHYVSFTGASIPEYTHYETPLGLVRVSDKAVYLREKSPFTCVKEAHTREHCIEVQLPFLQAVLSDFEIIPIVLGAVNPQEVSHALLPLIDETTLVIASSDLSHYHSYETACALDAICTGAVPGLHIEKMHDCHACGRQALLTLMYIAAERGWEGKLLQYRNSGDVSGEKERVVGYMAVAFYRSTSGTTMHLDEAEQDYAIHLARETLELYIREGKTPHIDEAELSDILKEKRGCFVTLNKNGMLRGCIGSLTSMVPLYEGIVENTINAALRDPRFPPVTPEELADITIEISVLTPPREISYETTGELIGKIEGKGVIIQSGYSQATFLPQVWEQLPSPQEFLSHLCMKAGLSSDYWNTHTLTVFIYEAQAFGES